MAAESKHKVYHVHSLSSTTATVTIYLLIAGPRIFKKPVASHFENFDVTLTVADN
jgi:hypothetical protein